MKVSGIFSQISLNPCGDSRYEVEEDLEEQLNKDSQNVSSSYIRSILEDDNIFEKLLILFKRHFEVLPLAPYRSSKRAHTRLGFSSTGSSEYMNCWTTFLGLPAVFVS